MTREPQTSRRAGVALLVLASAVLACAGGRGFHDAPAAQAVPEPDPVCRGTAQQRMLAHGLEQVVVRVSIDRRGKADVLEFVAPHLTPTEAEEIRAALQGCPWTPPAPAGGKSGAYVATVPFRSR